jgi:hypothetical protein
VIVVKHEKQSAHPVRDVHRYGRDVPVKRSGAPKKYQEVTAMAKRSRVIFVVLIAVMVSVSAVPYANGGKAASDVRDDHNSTGYLEVFYPSDDTWISMRSPDANYGSGEGMSVRNRYGHPSHPKNWERDVLVRYDLSSIPSGTPIASAVLYLYYYDYGDSDPTGRDLTAYRITSDWSEDYVTWNTRPDLDPEATSYSIVPSPTGKWMHWDVTSDVQDFINGQEVNYGWQVMDTTYWGDFNIPIIKYRTKEYGDYIPYLEVEIASVWCKFDRFPGWVPRTGSLDFTLVGINPHNHSVIGEGQIEVWKDSELLHTIPYWDVEIPAQGQVERNFALGPVSWNMPLGAYTIINRFYADGDSGVCEEEFDVEPVGWVIGSGGGGACPPDTVVDDI